MADPNAPVTFAIPGYRGAATRGAAGPAPLPGGLRTGHVETSVRVAFSRDAGLSRVDAVPGTHVVAISIDGGPELILHPHTARELLQAQEVVAPRAKSELRSGEVYVPPTLRWPEPQAEASAARSRIGNLVGGIVVKAVDVVRDVLTDAAKDAIKDKASAVAARFLAKKVDDQVTEGMYLLRSDKLELKGKEPLTAVSPGRGPFLVFIHGTFSSTVGGFGRLWTESPGRIADLFNKYDRSVYALDHATLCASPIGNALSLAAVLPRGTRLHLVTHSRGGLVAEVLALVCARRTIREEDLAAFIPEQQDELQELVKAVVANDLHVDRIVRVGCPIRGTLLASKRLDAYLSVLKWTMDVAGWGIAGEVVDFLGAVAQQRLEADSLPGLAAQVPLSPLVQWLHADAAPIPGELRVVSGDVQGDSVLTWIKTLMADGFYWVDNDVVVQTRSMYGGSRRQGTAMFRLDRGGKVLHTRYFARDRVAEPVFRAILDDRPDGFQTIGPLSWAGTDSSGDRARLTGTSTAASQTNRPAVFLIPGFGASTLTSGHELVWPAAMATATISRLAFTPGAAPLTAEGFVGDTFDTLHKRLEATHDVIRFPYDWRVPLEVEAARLARELEAAFAPRSTHPVRLLTHGSGALLARVLQLDHPQVWDRLLTHPDGRIVMLAPPNDGTWTPMQVLSGDDTFGGLLTTGAPPFGEPKVRAAFGTMPGLMQLQAQLIDDRLRLADVETWRRFAAADAEYERDKQSWHRLEEQREQARWGTPSESALGMAVALRRRLDDAVRRLAPEHARKIVVVAGAGAATADGLPDEVLSSPDKKPTPFVYVDTTRGDGRIAVARTPLSASTTYVIEADHGSLPSLEDAIPAYVELLNKGTTRDLPIFAATDAREDVRTTSRASRKNPPEVPGNPRDILSSRRRASAQPSEERRAIRISVVHGDLTFVAEPIMIGHYRSTRLTGTEWVMDRLVGGVMSRSLAIDVYPDRPSSYQVFWNTHVRGDDRIRIPRPAAVVVVGLGEEGTLTAADLVLTVRKGVIAWAERVAERKEAPPTFDLAATLIGSGGKGMDVAQVAPLLAEAVSDAAALLQSVDLPRVGEFKIIELFLDRATDAWHALMDQAKQAPHRYQVAPAIIPGSAALRPVPGTHYRGANYDFVSIVSRGSGRDSELAYTVDGRRARTDVARQVPQMPLLLQLLDASNAHPAPPDLGRTLFNLLVPIELEPFLGNATDIVLELDDGTAGIPWEMLDTVSGNRGQETAPWAIRSKIVRKLRVDVSGPARTTATADDYVLVIGEPRCDPDLYLRLPGARREATAVADRFEKSHGPSVVRAIAVDDDDVPGPESVAVLSALYRHPYRIIHIAGHGEPTITDTREGGVVLSPFGPDKRETYLGPKEIQSIRTVPELVFINCCHVGARERLQLLVSDDKFSHPYNRPMFAATLARKLIEIGVCCVIVAGWAVDDEAAKTFALTFYDEILRNGRFIDATAKARTETRAMGGTTWAAFQCWGDPEWRYQGQTSDAQGSKQDEAPHRQHAEAASPDALVVTLETIAIRAEVDTPDDTQRKDAKTYVTMLEHQFRDSWGGMGRVANAFGKAWVALGNREKAAMWYQRAVNANDGTAPIRAAEQLANVRVRLAWDRVSNIDGSTLSDEERIRLAKATGEIESEVASVQLLMQLRPTLEQGSLLGSAFKRLAMVAAKAGNGKAERDACAKMRDAYADAEAHGVKDSLDLFYPAWNRLVADAVAVAGRSKGEQLDADRVAAYRKLLARKREQDEDFWSAVAEFELEMIEAVAAGTLATAAAPLAHEFRRLAERVPATWMWSSVHDNSTFVLDLYRRRLSDRAGKPARLVSAELAAVDALLSVLGELAGKRAANGTGVG